MVAPVSLSSPLAAAVSLARSLDVRPLVPSASAGRLPCPACGSVAWDTDIVGSVVVDCCLVCGSEWPVVVLPF